MSNVEKADRQTPKRKSKKNGLASDKFPLSYPSTSDTRDLLAPLSLSVFVVGLVGTGEVSDVLERGLEQGMIVYIAIWIDGYIEWSSQNAGS